MHKGKTYIMFTVIVALAVSTMLIIILNNNVILLDRHNINVPTDITAENAYDFVLALAEKKSACYTILFITGHCSEFEFSFIFHIQL